jgi:phenylacetate-coenzyme A ligase PaaK-like adenylate-forming protein
MLLTKELISHDQWTHQELRTYQLQSLKKVVRHAMKRSPFYKDFYGHIDTDQPFQLDQLPILTKKTMMENFDRLVTDPRLKLTDVEGHISQLCRDEYYLDKYRALSTGGSSGLTGVFIYGRKEWVTILAAMQRQGRYIDVSPRFPNRLKMCNIGAHHPRHGTSRVPESADFGLVIFLRLAVESPIKELVESLNAFQPEVLTSYPSIISMLALEQQEGYLKISPRVVVTTAEVCTEDMKQKIKYAWGITPFNSYAMTEMPFLAINCLHDKGIHVFEDTAILEVVDENNRPVPDGVLGHKILITNLFSYTQPIIRYEITDMIKMSEEPCSCGRPFRLIKSVEGRIDDILELEGIHSESVLVHPIHFRTELGKIHELRQYQVIHKKDCLHFNLVLRGPTDRDHLAARVESIFKKRLKSVKVKCPTIIVHFVNELEREQNQVGKLKLIKKCIPEV